MGREVGSEEGLTHDQEVIAAAERIGADEDRSEDNVGVVASGLIGARTIESPDRRLGVLVDDPGLRADVGSRLGAIDPDVFGSLLHVSLQLWPSGL